jgi:hypothetical protein
LRNIESHGGILPPGVIRCNVTNTCKDINFDNVKIDGWWTDMKWSFISEYANGSVVNSYPDPMLGVQSERVFQLETIPHFFDLTNELIGYY